MFLGVWADLQDFDCSIRNCNNFLFAYDFLAVLGINRLIKLSLFYYVVVIVVVMLMKLSSAVVTLRVYGRF